MSELSEAEREAMVRAYAASLPIHPVPDSTPAAYNKGFGEGWLAARAYYRAEKVRALLFDHRDLHQTIIGAEERERARTNPDCHHERVSSTVRGSRS